MGYEERPRAGDADLWIEIWEELHELLEEAYRTKKGKMTKFERFVTEGNEKADELAEAGAMLDEGFMAKVRAGTIKQERASFHCLVEQWKDCEELKPKPKEKRCFVDWRSEGMKHRTEWCAEADRYRCMRCGRGSKFLKMARRCEGPKFFSKRLEN